MYKIVVTKTFEKRLSRLTLDWQHRIMDKINSIAENPYGNHKNVKKLQGCEGYRLRVGDWRIIYDLQNDALVMLVMEMDTRGGIYK